MTLKQGFKAGALLGIIAWILMNGVSDIIIPGVPFIYVRVLATVVFLLSILLTIASVFQRRAVFGTSIAGLIFGFATVFDIIYVINQMMIGQLPLP
jgi:hypothetical protein